MIYQIEYILTTLNPLPVRPFVRLSVWQNYLWAHWALVMQLKAAALERGLNF